MDKLRFLTESRNGKESVIEKLIHKDNSSSNRISCRIAEKSDIKSMMDVCFTRQKWMSERGLGCVVFKETREYYRQKIREHKMMVCVQDDKVLGFCIVSKQDLAEHWPTSLKDGYDGVYVFDCMSLPNTGQEILRLLFDHIMNTLQSDIRLDMEMSNDRLESFYKDRLGFSVVGKSAKEGTTHLLMEKTYTDISESFTRKISRKKNNELTTKSDTAFVPDGVYILHETLGVKGVEGWNPKNNDGVVGVLVVEDDHKILIATEDAPENLTWSKKPKSVNQPIEELEDAESDFNGEYYCQKLNSPDFPAVYYCKTYNKGNRSWYLPSAGELRLINNHLEEVQNALSIVGGQKFVTNWNEGVPAYWSSTEGSATRAWTLDTYNVYLDNRNNKVSDCVKVRPVSNFIENRNLKESFTKKTTTKGRNEIIGQADNLVVDYENIIKGLIKKYGFSTIHKYVLSLSRCVGYKEPPYVRRHEPFTEDKMVTILGELEFDKSETSDNDITVIWRKAKKFHYRTPIEKTEKFSELSEDEKRDIYEYLINWLKPKN